MLVYSEYIKVYNIKGKSVKRVFDNSNPLDRTMYLNALYIGNTSFVTLNINRENNLTEELTATKFIERY